MKTLLLGFGLLMVAAPAVAAERSVTFSVPDMTCALCPLTIKTAMENVPGVKFAVAIFETKIAVAIFEDTATNPEAIAAASADAGYPASLMELK